ncbi:MAG: extracellular solute-binding protein [Deltaproteobacteria bacterium]|nr:extracellular solute-binding protein [Deltaproteobacteria bacterium]
MTKIVGLAWLFVLVCQTALAFGQDARLVESGRKEGKAVVYSSLESDIAEAIGKAFRKKTGIQMEYWRASASKVIDRALSEHRAGRPLFDVIILTDSPLKILWKEGIFARYHSPSARGFPQEAIHPDLGPRYRNIIVGVLYNKSMIKPADAPKSLEELVNPRYRGKLVMPDPTQHTTTTQWVASLYKLMGKEKANRFIRDLAAMKPILVESLLPAAERVTTGETPLAITYVKYAFIFGKRGAPLDYVRLGKMLGEGNYALLGNKSAHPNAGKAFIDYFLDDESMRILAEMGEFVNRRGVYPPLPDADKIQFVEMEDLDKKGFAEKKEEYSKIFLQ